MPIGDSKYPPPRSVIIYRTSASKLIGKLGVPLSLLVVAVALAWCFFAIVTPYAMARQPGRANPTFAWYVVYHMIPPVFIGLEMLLVGIAWWLWRR